MTHRTPPPAKRPVPPPPEPGLPAGTAVRITPEGQLLPAGPLYSAEITLAPKAGRAGFVLRSQFVNDPAQAIQEIKQFMLPAALDMTDQINAAVAQQP